MKFLLLLLLAGEAFTASMIPAPVPSTPIPMIPAPLPGTIQAIQPVPAQVQVPAPSSVPATLQAKTVLPVAPPSPMPQVISTAVPAVPVVPTAAPVVPVPAPAPAAPAVAPIQPPPLPAPAPALPHHEEHHKHRRRHRGGIHIKPVSMKQFTSVMKEVGKVAEQGAMAASPELKQAVIAGKSIDKAVSALKHGKSFKDAMMAGVKEGVKENLGAVAAFVPVDQVADKVASKI